MLKEVRSPQRGAPEAEPRSRMGAAGNLGAKKKRAFGEARLECIGIADTGLLVGGLVEDVLGAIKN